jgi:putative ABC transport system permease protein
VNGLSVIWTLVLAHVRHQPRRLCLAALAVVAAACAVVWVVSGYDALVSHFDDHASTYLGRYDVLLVPAGPAAVAFPAALVDQLRQDPAVAEVNPVVQSRVTVRNATGPADGSRSNDALTVLGGDRPPVNGAPPVDPTLVGTGAAEPPHELLDGRWLDPQDTAAVMTSDSAKRLGIKVGDEVVVTAVASQFRLPIVGLVQEPAIEPSLMARGERPGAGGAGPKPRRDAGPSDTARSRPGAKGAEAAPSTAGPVLPIGRGPGPAASALYVPVMLAERINGYAFQPNVLQIALQPKASGEAFRQRCTQRLAQARLPVNVVDLAGVKAGLERNMNVSLKKTQAYSAAGMALLAALFIIFTTLSMGVSERVREMAVLRAVGLTRAHVVGMVFAESLLLGAVGWAGGLVAGWGLLQLARQANPDLFRGGVTLGPWTVLLTGITAFGGAFAAAIPPAWRAARVQPLDALHAAQSRPSRRFPALAAAAGLLLLTVNPAVVYLVPVPEQAKLWVYAGLGYPSMVIGCLLLAPLAIVFCEAYLAPAVAWLLALDRRLLASHLSSNLWRTLGTTVALCVGLGLYVSIQVWGYSMLEPFQPGDWLPDALLAFQPVGLDASEVDAVRNTPGVRAEQCLPLAVEQARLTEASKRDARRVAGASMLSTLDNVVLFGLDPQPALGGATPLLRLRFVEGDRDTAIAELQQGRRCIISEDFRRASGLHLGDTLEVIPPNAPQRTVAYRVAGVVAMPGWHWITKFSGVRRQAVRTSGLVLANYDDVHRDFALRGVAYFWFNTDGHATPKALEDAFQTLAARHAGEKYSAPGQGLVTVHRPSARVTATETIHRAINLRADDVIWGMSMFPLVTLAVTSLGVLNTIAASVRARRWEMGVLRALGVTQWGLVRLVLADGVLIGLVACVLSLAFGLLAGWCGLGMAEYTSVFGGMAAPLVLPWGKLAAGFSATLALCLAAALWPAVSIGRTEPLRLLQEGRATM